jgi:PIN domain nuclease of toxin-antitoxin system
MGLAKMILLDTHIWLWWINGDLEKVGDIRKNLIEKSDKVVISAISCFEIAWLEKHRRIKLPVSLERWFEMALDNSGIELLAFNATIATLAVHLEEHHSDPLDRIIIGTSIFHQAKLMSNDLKFKKYIELKDLLI